GTCRSEAGAAAAPPADCPASAKRANRRRLLCTSSALAVQIVLQLIQQHVPRFEYPPADRLFGYSKDFADLLEGHFFLSPQQEGRFELAGQPGAGLLHQRLTLLAEDRGHWPWLTGRQAVGQRIGPCTARAAAAVNQAVAGDSKQPGPEA